MAEACEKSSATPLDFDELNKTELVCGFSQLKEGILAKSHDSLLGPVASPAQG
jgi:hypothetical protein